MKIIITDCDHANLNEEIEVFNKYGFEYELLQCKTEQDLIDNCKNAEVFLNQYAPFTKKVFEALPNLKHIVRYGVGVNNIDLDAATQHGVIISNVPDYGTNEVADQAVALMMALVRKIVEVVNYTKTTDWDYKVAIPIYRLQEQTVGIVGLGRIGGAFAERMSGFGVKIIACDPIYNIGDEVKGAQIVDFKTLVETSDIVSIHTPLTKQTADMFDLNTMKMMKKSAYLINVSRGGIINEDDLYTALTEKIIAGAGIDVVLSEPMKPGAKLFSLDNFLITPHIAWYSQKSALELKTKAAEEACRFASGEKTIYAVNSL